MECHHKNLLAIIQLAYLSDNYVAAIEYLISCQYMSRSHSITTTIVEYEATLGISLVQLD